MEYEATVRGQNYIFVIFKEDILSIFNDRRYTSEILKVIHSTGYRILEALLTFTILCLKILIKK